MEDMKEPIIFELYNKVKTSIYHQVEAQCHGEDDAETKRRVVESRAENITKLAIDPMWTVIKSQSKQIESLTLQLKEAREALNAIGMQTMTMHMISGNEYKKEKALGDIYRIVDAALKAIED